MRWQEQQIFPDPVALSVSVLFSEAQFGPSFSPFYFNVMTWTQFQVTGRTYNSLSQLRNLIACLVSATLQPFVSGQQTLHITTLRLLVANKWRKPFNSTCKHCFTSSSIHYFLSQLSSIHVNKNMSTLDCTTLLTC